MLNTRDFADTSLCGPIPVSECNKIVLIRFNDDTVATNVPHYVVHHSPGGFNFGYMGSGPSDLALNIAHLLVETLGLETLKSVKCYKGHTYALAWAMKQDLKVAFISGINEDNRVIDIEDLIRWVNGWVEQRKEALTPPDNNGLTTE